MEGLMGIAWIDTGIQDILKSWDITLQLNRADMLKRLFEYLSIYGKEAVV